MSSCDTAQDISVSVVILLAHFTAYIITVYNRHWFFFPLLDVPFYKEKLIKKKEKAELKTLLTSPGTTTSLDSDNCKNVKP